MLHMSDRNESTANTHENIPVSALRKATIQALSSSLNLQKVIPSENGLPRDWRGLAHLVGVTGVEMSHLSALPDPTTFLITSWAHGNVRLLCSFMEEIDRYDVLDDVRDLISKDCADYTSLPILNNRLEEPSSSILNNQGDELILTRDDIDRMDKGLPPQIYDAYVLYVDEDADFAAEVVQTLECKYNMKLCTRDRDLIGGITFEHDAVMRLIAERCRRLIVVVTSGFLKSPASKFLVTFAQALGIDQRQRKVVPVLYERCQLPPELSYYFLLDYNRAGKLYNFWEKLRDSIMAAKPSEKMPISKSEVDRNQESVSSEIWMSKTEFPDSQPSGSKFQNLEVNASPDVEKVPQVESEVKAEPKQKKKTNVYKIIKKAVRNKSSDHVTSTRKYTSSDSNVEFEQFSNSSSFESPKNEEKDSKKKKWFRRKNVEPMLS